MRRVNTSGARLLRQKFETLLGQYSHNLFPSEEKLELLKQAFETKQRITEKILIGEEELLMQATVDPIWDENKEISGCVVILREVI
ncbi:MAG: PAS domain-containing protein [Blastocatellia bacterium]|nr:PAS domain-containing protein [Blastocatellia bacterium]